MQVSVIEIAVLIGCFFASGFFSGSEAVLMSIPFDRARQLIERGGAKGSALKFMIDHPSELLVTILVGNNIVNIYAASLTTTIFSRLFNNDAVGISVGVTTFVILIFGEIIPKTFARAHAERLSTLVIRVLQTCYYMMYPIVRGIVWVMRVVLGENTELQGRMVTKKDIEYYVNKAEQEKTMDSKQLDMLTSILDFPRIKVKDVMIQRSKIKAIQLRSSLQEVIDYISEDVHSRYPVIDGELENIKGFLHVKDLAFLTEEDKDSFNLSSYLKEPFFVYEHMKIQSVFDHMNRKKVHQALVKDENSIVVGIVTLEDIVEEVLGDIQDEHDKDESSALEESEGIHSESGVLLDSTISLRDLDDEFEVEIPLNDNYSTLAGFILDMLGNNFPENGQIIVYDNWTFELEEVVNNEIKTVRIKSSNGVKHIMSKKPDPREADEENEDLEQSSYSYRQIKDH